MVLWSEVLCATAMEANTSRMTIAAPSAANAVLFFNILSFSLYFLMNEQRGTFRKNHSDPPSLLLS